MENRLISATELKSLETLPEGIELVAIKFVSIGHKTMSDVAFSSQKICEITAQQPIFFIISQSSEAFREILHNYVDRFCDAKEGKS